ncbi:MAG TPA: DUF3098 domain-containing protein [Sunxiuqinia sp.]|nr:DUF3098 domain-containing protein [Sunxiuqinia sp.]
MLFGKKKYLGLIIALFLLILAYVLMSGPDNSGPAKFNDAVFNFRRVTLAPLVIIGTYIGLIVLILKQPEN